MPLMGEAKKQYQRGYMRGYMRRMRALSEVEVESHNEESPLRETIERVQGSLPLRPVQQVLNDMYKARRAGIIDRGGKKVRVELDADGNVIPG